MPTFLPICLPPDLAKAFAASSVSNSLALDSTYFCPASLPSSFIIFSAASLMPFLIKALLINPSAAPPTNPAPVPTGPAALPNVPPAIPPIPAAAKVSSILAAPEPAW